MSASADRRDLHDEAAEWFVRSRGPGWSALDAARLEAWLAADPRHRASFDGVARSWDATAEAAASPGVRALRSEALAATRTARRRLLSWVGLAAAMLTLAVLGAGVLSSLRLAAPEPGVQVYRTEVGERATVTLADGSQATLNTASELAVEYTRSRRGLRLVAGEAWFDVAKNPDRPFVVTAGCDSHVE